jgi:hypothetical protein
MSDLFKPYVVSFYSDSNYAVYWVSQSSGDRKESPEFVGSLSDCEAWIRLTEGGYL